MTHRPLHRGQTAPPGCGGDLTGRDGESPSLTTLRVWQPLPCAQALPRPSVSNALGRGRGPFPPQDHCTRRLEHGSRMLMAVPRQVLPAGLCTHTNTCTHGAGAVGGTHALPCALWEQWGWVRPGLQDEGGRQRFPACLVSSPRALPQHLREKGVFHCAPPAVSHSACPTPAGLLGALNHMPSMGTGVPDAAQGPERHFREAVDLHRAQGAHTKCAYG